MRVAFWVAFAVVCVATSVVVAIVFGAIAEQRDAPEHFNCACGDRHARPPCGVTRTPGAVNPATWSTHRGIDGD